MIMTAQEIINNSEEVEEEKVLDLTENKEAPTMNTPKEDTKLYDSMFPGGFGNFSS